MPLKLLQSESTLLGTVLDLVYRYFLNVRKTFGRVGKGRIVVKMDHAPIDVLIQDVDLSVTNLASAKRAVNLMIARLTPIPPEQITWDLAGPISKTGERNRYHLAVVRKKDLEQWGAQHPTSGMLSVESTTGSVFQFRSGITREYQRKSTLVWLAAFFAFYSSLWLLLGEWADRPQRISDMWQNQAQESRRSVAGLKEEYETLSRQIAIVTQHKQSTKAQQHLQVLAELVRSLPENGWLQEYNASDDQVRISGYTSAASELTSSLEAMSVVERVESVSIVPDSVSGLQRFSLIIIFRNRANIEAQES